jgi:hypothetical protein
MPDKLEKLRATLAELHAELEELDETDPQVRDLLRSALGELHGAIEEHGPRFAERLPPEARAGLLDRLREAVRHYHESHPAMAASVGSVIDVLGRMGI